MGEKDDMKDQDEKDAEESEATEEAEDSEDSEDSEESREEAAARSAEAAEAAEADAAPSEEEVVEAPIAEEIARDAEKAAAEREEPAVAIEAPPHEVEGVAAFFDHPKHLLAAATYARDSDYQEFDAYSPFPIHGMDEAMGLGPSWIPWVTFGAGATGFILANAMQFGMMTFDWPMIVGGKPFAPWPSFVPIMFELTVLLAGVTTAVVMLKAAGCFEKPTIIDPRITDDRFVLWISANDDKFDETQVTEFLEDLNPLEVRKIVKDA